MRPYFILRPLAFLVVVCALAGGFASIARGTSPPPRYGMYLLSYGYDYGADPLNGTTSDIIVNSAAPGGSYCDVFRSDAEDDAAGYLIQVGAVKCGSYQNLDQTCSTHNDLVNFVEYLTPGNPYKCIAEGGISTGSGFLAAVENTGGSTWTAYLNYYAAKSISAESSMQYLIEGAEHTNDNCSGWSGSGTWGSGPTSSYRWLFLSSGTWYQVTHAESFPGCWSISGGPSGTFTISH